MLLKYYRHYSIFRRIFNALIIIILSCTIVFSLFFYAVFSKSTIEQAQKMSEEMLVRLKFMTRQIFNEADSVLLSLGAGENHDLNIMMFHEEHDRMIDYSGISQMRQLQSNYSAIAYIGIYNGIRDEAMCTIGLNDSFNEMLCRTISENYTDFDNRIIIPFENKMIVPKEYDPNLNTVTIIYYSPLSSSRSIGAVFLGIDCEYLSQYISEVQENDYQTVLTVNSGGTVITHPEMSQIFANYSENVFVKSVMDKGDDSGYFTVNGKEGKSLVTFFLEKEIDLRFISIIPYAEILSGAKQTRNIILLVASSIIVLGTLFSLIAAKRTFNPLAALLTKTGYTQSSSPKEKTNEIDYLDRRLTDYIKSSKMNDELLTEFALELLLRGKLGEDKAKLLFENESLLTAPYYLLCLFSVNLG